jgi:hypothetical protein
VKIIMSYKPWNILIPLLLLGVIAAFAHPAAAYPSMQVQYQTPTAQPDGRVIYKVQEGDSCLRIELLTGVKVEVLRELNKLDTACTINPGQEILLKLIIIEPTPTLNPDMTATPPLPTPTAIKGTGKICAMLFNDINGNAVHEENELAMNGGAVSISNRAGSVSQTGNTNDGVDPLCIDIPEGEYNISMAIPGGFNGTTLLNQVLTVQPGETAVLEFGAQQSTLVASESNQQPETPTTVENNQMLAILGGVLVLLGIGLGAYILFTRGK